MRQVVVIGLLAVASSTMVFAADPPALLTAIRNGDHAQVRKVIDAGGNVNTVDNDGTTLVSALDPQLLVSVPGRPELEPIAAEAKTRLQAALATIAAAAS